MTATSEMQRAVDAFVAQLTDIVRRENLALVTQALNGKNGNGHRDGIGKPGQKRNPKVLADTVKEVDQYIQAHPGQGVEEIRMALNRTTAELTLPIQKLLAAKAITRKGQKRATKYFPAGKAAAKS